MPKNTPTQKHIGAAGLNTKDSDVEIGFRELTEAINIDLTRKRKIRRRSGVTNVVSGSPTSAYMDKKVFLYTEGGALKRMYPDYSTETVRTGLDPTGKLAALRVGDNVYYSEQSLTGVYNLNGSNRTLGLTRPSPPGLTAIAGNLRAGRYMVVCTFVRDDGQESGSSPYALIELQKSSGIQVSLPSSSDQTVISVNVYITTPDGNEYFLAGVADNGDATFDFQGYARDLQVPLKTHQLTRPIAFHDIALHYGRMLYAVDDLLLYSEPYAYELIDLGRAFIQMPGKVTLLAPTTNGVFIGTEDEIHYASGKDIADATAKKIADYGAFEGSKTYVNGSVLGGNDSEDELPLWASSEGFCVGTDSGQIQNITVRKVDTPETGIGTSMFRKENGQYHVISVIKS